MMNSSERPDGARTVARSNRIVMRLANADDREKIYHLRHDVYAQELGQHSPNTNGRLSDALDKLNVYLVASLNDVVAGFISITPPEGGQFSVDKYVRRVVSAFPQGDRRVAGGSPMAVAHVSADRL